MKSVISSVYLETDPVGYIFNPIDKGFSHLYNYYK